MNAGRGQQAPTKAAHSFQKEVRQNIKDKKRDKIIRDGDPSWGGSHEGEEVSTLGNSLKGGYVGSFGISKGNITRRGKKKKTKTKNHRIGT